MPFESSRRDPSNQFLFVCLLATIAATKKTMKCPWPLVQSLSYPCLCWWNPCLHRLNHKKFYLLFVGQTGVKSYLPNNFNGENVWKYANTAQDWSPCSEKPETSFWCCFGGLIPNFVGKISSYWHLQQAAVLPEAAVEPEIPEVPSGEALICSLIQGVFS